MPTLRFYVTHLLMGATLALSLAIPATCAAGVIAPAALPPPISLTASDGSGLELVSLTANAVVEDPLAFTELRLVFRNPESRVREGRFRITLPAGATISRFAMRIGDRWQEGEVVEQQAARVAYEDFLHRRQDPALLEAEAGNEFSARVFPIPAGATKELIVSYSQELTRAAEPYRLPLRGLPRLGALAIRAIVAKTAATGGAASNMGGLRAQHEVVEVSRRNYVPDRDFEVAHAGGRLGLRHEKLVVARIVPVAESDKRDPVTSLTVLIDTSASRALGFGEQIAAFESLLAELRKSGAGDPTVTIAAFDQDVAPLYTGKASGIGDSVRKRLLERRALGASDLERALGWLACQQGPSSPRPAGDRRRRHRGRAGGRQAARQGEGARRRRRRAAGRPGRRRHPRRRDDGPPGDGGAGARRRRAGRDAARDGAGPPADARHPLGREARGRGGELGLAERRQRRSAGRRAAGLRRPPRRQAVSREGRRRRAGDGRSAGGDRAAAAGAGLGAGADRAADGTKGHDAPIAIWPTR